jgi:hypothetical protein
LAVRRDGRSERASASRYRHRDAGSRNAIGERAGGAENIAAPPALACAVAAPAAGGASRVRSGAHLQDSVQKAQCQPPRYRARPGPPRHRLPQKPAKHQAVCVRAFAKTTRAGSTPGASFATVRAEGDTRMPVTLS